MNKFVKFIVKLSAFITFTSLFFIILYILFKGIPHLKASLFEINYSSENVSLFPALITSLLLVFLSIVIAAPIGIFTAFYLIEYSGNNNLFTEIVRLATESLSAIPSIVFGLFGMLFFVMKLGFGYSLLAGVLTSSIMVLPIIIRTTEEALISVDPYLREASYGLGAGKLSTIFKIILPISMPAILSGLMLVVGRIIGETAALIYTLGTVPKIPRGLFSSGRSLSLHMYLLSTEGLHMNESYATGLILLLTVLLINILSSFLANRLGKY